MTFSKKIENKIQHIDKQRKLTLNGIKSHYYNWIFDNNNTSSLEKIYLRFFGFPVLGKRFRLNITEHYLINDIKKIHSVLDIGCGLGELSIYLAKYGKNVTSIDNSRKSIELLYKYCNQNDIKIKAFLCDIDKDGKWKNKKYDLILCIAVLDYLKHPEFFLHNITKLLKKGGLLYLGIPLSNRKTYKPYEKIAKAKTNINGFSMDTIFSVLKKRNMKIISYKKYLPLNIFYYMSKGVYLLNKIGVNYEKSLAILYPIFLPLSIASQKLFSNSGTEIIIKLQKQ